MTATPLSTRPGRVLRLVLRAPRALYRCHLGWLLGRRFLLLEHVGRRTGRRHTTVVEVIDHDGTTGAMAVMSGWGRTSDWYRNIEVASQARVTFGGKSLVTDVRTLSDSEAVKVLADYERRNRWIRPVVRRVLSQLAGFDYDGTDEDRLELVRQLPIVRFTPPPPENVPSQANVADHHGSSPH